VGGGVAGGRPQTEWQCLNNFRPCRVAAGPGGMLCAAVEPAVRRAPLRRFSFIGTLMRMPFQACRRALTLALLAIPLSGMAAPDNAAAKPPKTTLWPQGGYDAGWSYDNPFESVLSGRSVKRLTRSWGEIEVGNYYLQPAVAGGRMFVCTNLYGLQARDLASGEVIWTNGSFPCKGAALAGSRVITVGRGYPSGLNTVTATDARTGQVVWQITKPPKWGTTYTFNPPVVSGDTVFVSGEVGEVYALAAATGEERWHVETRSYNSSPSVADGRVFLSNRFDPAAMLALDAATGRKLWRRTLDESDTWYAPAVAGGRVFVGTVGGRLHALEPATGRLLWTRQLSNYQWGPLVVGDDTLYANLGGLAALDVATGETRWTQPGLYPYSMVLANGLLYCSGNDPRNGPFVQTVAAATGALATAFGDIYSETFTLAVADGHVIVSGGQSLDVFGLPAQSSVRSRQISGNSTTSSILRK